jgi:hypothetical protein
MRFLMKILLPTSADNLFAATPDIEQKLSALFARIGALATYPTTVDASRCYYVLVDVEPECLTATAEPVFQLLGVKPEFLPEVLPKPYYGHSGY